MPLVAGHRLRSYQQASIPTERWASTDIRLERVMGAELHNVALRRINLAKTAALLAGTNCTKPPIIRYDEHNVRYMGAIEKKESRLSSPL